MDYKVFYRKYRPSNFKSIVGQDYTVRMLKNAIVHNKISHAYLFTGPRGTGKTSTAKVFAKTINCENLIDGEACGKCRSCLNFTHSSDIIEIDAASNNGVDDIRELINNVKIAPSESRYKIYIIDEVHMMTQSAFNALLLTLEEPPAHAIFIMATTNVESVPITILSRCQRFNFKKIALEDIVNQIKYVCEQENINITDEAVHEIAYLSEGGLRDAESLLDQLSGSGEEITIEKILSNYGSISSLFVRNLVNAMESGDIQQVLSMITELSNSSCDYKIFIKKFIQELIQKAVVCKEDPSTSKLSYEELKDLIFDLNDCMNKVSIHISPYALIQITLLKYTKSEKNQNTKSEQVGSKVDNMISFQPESSMEEKTIQDKRPKNVVFESSLVSTHSENLESSSLEEPSEDFEEEMNEYLEELKNIRVNNCLATATKSFLIEYQKILLTAIQQNSLSLDISSLLVDVKIGASGPNWVILVASLESTANLINQRIEEIEKELENYFPQKVSLIAVFQEEWNLMKQEYIQNKKNGVKYEVIDESGLVELKPQKESQLEKFAADLFGSDKIQII